MCGVTLPLRSLLVALVVAEPVVIMIQVLLQGCWRSAQSEIPQYVQRRAATLASTWKWGQPDA